MTLGNRMTDNLFRNLRRSKFFSTFRNLPPPPHIVAACTSGSMTSRAGRNEQEFGWIVSDVLRSGPWWGELLRLVPGGSNVGLKL